MPHEQQVWMSTYTRLLAKQNEFAERRALESERAFAVIEAAVRRLHDDPA